MMTVIGPARVIDLRLSAGISRDALLAAILDRVPADGRLMWTRTCEGDALDHLLVWEKDLPASMGRWPGT